MNINVHIERLILDGLPTEVGQGALVQAAVETELTRLLTEGGLEASVQSGGVLPSVRADSIQLAIESHPTLLGHQIAQAVYGGIGKAK